MDPAAVDAQIRLAAFSFLDGYTLTHGELVPRSVLASGFVFNGERVALVGPQGIFKPAQIRTEVRRDILREVDGPMLRHGLQDLNGSRLLVLPRQPIQQPSRDNLEARYELFRQAG